jgi:hypothetical protein
MEYVKGCAECQRHKVNNRPTKALLQPIYPKPEAMPFETVALCYGRLAIVSDVDGEGVCPECRQRVERICRAITKQVQRSDARIEVDMMHTRDEFTE